MTEREYRQHPAISRSELWRISESPEKFKYFKDNPEPSTPALVFGQVLHKLVLQPESFEDDFAVVPNVDRRTKEGKAAYAEFEAKSEGKTVITADIYKVASEMRDALYQNAYVRKLLSGEREKEYFWLDSLTGEECKCRVDCITTIGSKRLIVDLKSAASAETEAFIKAAIKHGYDFQSGMYIDGVKESSGDECDFVFIVVEKEPPYAINILQADKLFVTRGYDLFREYIGIYHDCKTTGNWYGYLGRSNVINSLGLPTYLAKEIG